jgi:hypothetical protein
MRASKRLRAAKASYENYDNGQGKFYYKNVNSLYPFFFIICGPTNYCSQSLATATSIVPSPRYSNNISKENTYEEGLHPADQVEEFDSDLRECDEVDLLNQLQYFSLIHHLCNLTLTFL